MARLEGAALGYSEARVVVVDHPIGGIDPEAVRGKADAAVDAVLAALAAR